MNKTLFWIEDDIAIADILSQRLAKTEFKVTLFKKGNEALEALKKTIPDVLVIDLILPGGIDGFGILEATGKDPRLAKVPKIVLSNLSTFADQDRARLLGANDYLVKAATSLDEIVVRIRRLANK